MILIWVLAIFLAIVCLHAIGGIASKSKALYALNKEVSKEVQTWKAIGRL